MKKYLLAFLMLTTVCISHTNAQQTLPGIGVTNYNGRIIINWKNAYKLPVTNISIQRSYDSLKNYSTIGSVLNPQNEENGYSDNDAPYNRMYYRVFIAFEGGSYIITPAVRPVKGSPSTNVASTDLLPWQIDPRRDSSFQSPPGNEVSYPSMRIFTAKDNTVVIHLPDVALKKYTVKFFNDLQKRLFDINDLKDEYLIIEKANFGRAGWYYFELYEDGVLIEKNRFMVPKDVKGNGKL